MDTIKINNGNTKMVAHRGVSGIERENTNAAFIASGNRSYFGTETDVHVTKDGKFVIIHDETLDRVTDGKCRINVEESSYDDFKDVILPDLDGSFARQDLKTPLLEEYVRICKKYGKVCVLEVKNPFSENDIKRLVEEIKGIGYLENVIFISFSLENCINLRNLLPDSNIQWLIGGDNLPDGLVDTLLKYNLDLDIQYTLLDKETIEMFHANGIVVNCWTCDDKDTAERLAEYGIDYITSNILE